MDIDNEVELATLSHEQSLQTERWNPRLLLES